MLNNKFLAETLVMNVSRQGILRSVYAIMINTSTVYSIVCIYAYLYVYFRLLYCYFPWCVIVYLLPVHVIFQRALQVTFYTVAKLIAPNKQLCISYCTE